MLLPFNRDETHTSLLRKPFEQCRLAARTRAQIQPTMLRTFDRHGCERERDELTAFVLDPGTAVADSGDRHGRATVQYRGSCRPPSWRGTGRDELGDVGPAWPSDECDCRARIVGGERGGQFVALFAQRGFSRLDHPTRVGVHKREVANAVDIRRRCKRREPGIEITL